MNIHEYQAKAILNDYGIKVPVGRLIQSTSDIRPELRRVESDMAVIKAQIHAGGRGKAGGVKLVKNFSEAVDVANNMLGMQLVTHQTTVEGITVEKLYVEEASTIEREIYIAMVINRKSSCVSLVVSPDGGMDIEEVAATSPHRIRSIDISPILGIKAYELVSLAKWLAFTPNLQEQFFTLVTKMYEIYTSKDCAMIEINPLIVNDQEELIALDAKIAFDDNAVCYHKDILKLADRSQEDAKEVEASKYQLSYIALDGEIGCMVNGAGLAMATVDAICYEGSSAANFLDVGGSATVENVGKAFEIIIADGNVKGIFVNIFGGIMKCDVIAQGIVNVAKEQDVNLPLVVRLEGANVQEGKKILEESGLNVYMASGLDEGAALIVRLIKEA